MKNGSTVKHTLQLNLALTLIHVDRACNKTLTLTCSPMGTGGRIKSRGCDPDGAESMTLAVSVLHDKVLPLLMNAEAMKGGTHMHPHGCPGLQVATLSRHVLKITCPVLTSLLQPAAIVALETTVTAVGAAASAGVTAEVLVTVADAKTELPEAAAAATILDCSAAEFCRLPVIWLAAWDVCVCTVYATERAEPVRRDPESEKERIETYVAVRSQVELQSRQVTERVIRSVMVERECMAGLFEHASSRIRGGWG